MSNAQDNDTQPPASHARMALQLFHATVASRGSEASKLPVYRKLKKMLSSALGWGDTVGPALPSDLREETVAALKDLAARTKAHSGVSRRRRPASRKVVGTKRTGNPLD
jgi:hypothetical protein